MTPAQRKKVVAAALAWENTPYHHQANIQGVGVDCVMLLVEVYKSCRLIPADFDPRPYARNWHLHRSDEMYLAGLERFGAPLRGRQRPLPGDIAMFQFGRCASHAALVLQWPLVLHAYADVGSVVQTDISKSTALTKRLRGFYRIKG